MIAYNDVWYTVKTYVYFLLLSLKVAALLKFSFLLHLYVYFCLLLHNFRADSEQLHLGKISTSGRKIFP